MSGPGEGIATRLEGVQRSGVRTIMERARSHPGTIRLDIGEPDFPTPEHIVEAAVRAARDGYTRYGPGSGLPELREAAAEKLARVNGIDVPANRVVVTAGAVNGILATLAALTRPGDGVAIPDPSWPNYRNMAVSLGLLAIPYPLDPATGFQPDLEGLARAIDTAGGARLVILNSPSNPTGVMWRRDDIAGLLELCRSRNVTLVSDECYDEIAFNTEHVSPASLDTDARIVSVFSLSKTYAMTGWRVGYLTAPAALISPIATIQEVWNSCGNAVAQKAGEAALTGDQSSVAAMVSAYRRRRDLAVERGRHHSLPILEPDGAFYAMIDVGTSDSVTFAERLVDEYGVSAAPGAAFGETSRTMVRVSLASDVDSILTGVDRIAAAVGG